MCGHFDPNLFLDDIFVTISFYYIVSNMRMSHGDNICLIQSFVWCLLLILADFTNLWCLYG